MNIHHLNFDILTYIVLYLSSDDIYAYVETCKLFYVVIDYIKKSYLNCGSVFKIRNPNTYHISNSIQLIEWAKIHPKFSFTNKLGRSAAQKNNLDILKYLNKNNYYFCPKVYCDAINNKNIKIIKWLRKKNVELNEYAFHEAAKIGNLKILKLLKRYNCDWNSVTCNHAISYGNLHSLKWLLRNGCWLDISSFNIAVESGNMSMIKYIYNKCLHDLSYPWWNSFACDIAAKKGDFSLLKWLRSKYCPWDVNCIYNAIKNNHFEIVKWAIENGCEINRSLYLQISSVIYINENSNIKFTD